jgi:hypothetical protein
MVLRDLSLLNGQVMRAETQSINDIKQSVGLLRRHL